MAQLNKIANMLSYVRRTLTPTCRQVGIFGSFSQSWQAGNSHILTVSTLLNNHELKSRQYVAGGVSCVVSGFISRNTDMSCTCSKVHSAATMDLHYEQIVELLAEQSIIFIDVREPSELANDGSIPGTINIPLGELKEALQMQELTFETKYGIPRPSADAPVVFHCRSGRRSVQAVNIARDLGFKNVRHYAGGYMDWQKHTAGS